MRLILALNVSLAANRICKPTAAFYGAIEPRVKGIKYVPNTNNGGCRAALFGLWRCWQLCIRTFYLIRSSILCNWQTIWFLISNFKNVISDKIIMIIEIIRSLMIKSNIISYFWLWKADKKTYYNTTSL